MSDLYGTRFKKHSAVDHHHGVSRVFSRTVPTAAARARVRRVCDPPPRRAPAAVGRRGMVGGGTGRATRVKVVVVGKKVRVTGSGRPRGYRRRHARASTPLLLAYGPRWRVHFLLYAVVVVVVVVLPAAPHTRTHTVRLRTGRAPSTTTRGTARAMCP